MRRGYSRINNGWWGFRGALGRTRTCDLLIRSLKTCVITGPSLSADFAYSSWKSDFALRLFSVPFGSVLFLLLPHCCHSSKLRLYALIDPSQPKTVAGGAQGYDTVQALSAEKIRYLGVGEAALVMDGRDVVHADMSRLG